MVEKKIKLEDHERIKRLSGGNTYKKLFLLDKLYTAEKQDNREVASLILTSGNTIYIQHGLESQKMGKWLKLEELARKNYASCPVHLTLYSNGILLHHGHHRLAAQRILGGNFIYAVIQTVESELDVDGLKTIDEAIAEYLSNN